MTDPTWGAPDAPSPDAYAPHDGVGDSTGSRPYGPPPVAGTAAPYPAQPYAGQPYPGQPYPGQPYPGQPYPGQPYAAQPYPGQTYAGQPYPGQPYPAQSYAGPTYGAAPPPYAGGPPPGPYPGYPGGPGYPGLALDAPKPGCVPLRPLGLSDILDGTFTAIRRNPKVMLGLSAAVGIASALVVFGAQAALLPAVRNINVNSSSDAAGNSSFGALVDDAGTILAFLISLTLGAFLTGMLTIAITQDALGNRLTIGQVWQGVRPRLVRLVLLSLLVGSVPVLGLLFCIAPGVWLWGIWTAAIPAMMVERTKVFESLGRSFRLVQGTFWRVWGIRALGTLIATVVGSMISVPFGLANLGSALNSVGSGGPADPSLWALALTALGSAVSTTITAPLRSGIDALLYVDLRMRKEGLDIALRQSVTEPVTDGAPRPGPFG